MTIGESTIETYTAFMDHARHEYRHCAPTAETYWRARISAYQAVIDAVRAAIASETREA